MKEAQAIVKKTLHVLAEVRKRRETVFKSQKETMGGEVVTVVPSRNIFILRTMKGPVPSLFKTEGDELRGKLGRSHPTKYWAVGAGGAGDVYKFFEMRSPKNKGIHLAGESSSAEGASSVVRAIEKAAPISPFNKEGLSSGLEKMAKVRAKKKTKK